MANTEPSSLDATEETEGSMAKVAWLLKESQEYERGLSAALKKELDSVAAGKKPTLTSQDIDDIVDEINNEAEKRKSYYELIQTARAAQMSGELVAEKAAQQQIQTYKYLEANLDAVKLALNAANDDRQKKMKMIEINTFYEKQYKGYGKVARGVAVIAGLLVVLFFLRRHYGYEGIISPIETVVKWAGGVYMVWTLYDVASRRNDDYDEYIFPLAPRSAEDLAQANQALEKPVFDVSGIDIPGLCMGSYCCGPGTSWNDNKGCIQNTNVVTDTSVSKPPAVTSATTPASTVASLTRTTVTATQSPTTSSTPTQASSNDFGDY